MDVLVEAFVDNNLGDDLMLDLLLRRYPTHRFWALGEIAFNQRLPYRDWQNFHIIPWATARACLPAFDAFVGIGGSLWQEAEVPWLAWPRQVILEQYRRSTKACLMLGNNIGPIHSTEGARAFAGLIERLDYITVRDRASQAWILEHCHDPAVRYQADLAFHYPLPSVPANPGWLGVAVRRDRRVPENNHLQAANLAKLLLALQRKQPYERIVLFGFNSGSENDAQLIELIHQQLGPKHGLPLYRLIYRGEIEPFLSGFCACQSIIAVRFHALILALQAGQACLPIAYQNKTSDFLSDLGYNSDLTVQNLGQRVDEAVELLVDHPLSLSQTALHALRESSEENFLATDPVFGSWTSHGKLLLQSLLEQATRGVDAQRELAALRQSRVWRFVNALRGLRRRVSR